MLKLKRMFNPVNYIIIAISAVLIIGESNIARADSSGTDIQLSHNTRQSSRSIVIAKLINIGYSQKDASEAVKDLSDEELDYLAKNPELVKRKGIIIIILACIGITFLVGTTAENAARN